MMRTFVLDISYISYVLSRVSRNYYSYEIEMTPDRVLRRIYENLRRLHPEVQYEEFSIGVLYGALF